MISPIFSSTRLCVTACGIMHPLQCRPAASWVPYTTSCNTQSSAPEDGRNHCPKHVELIGIINKSVIVASSWLYYLCCNMYIPSLFMIISQFLACYLFDHVFLKLLLHSSRNSRPLKVKALFLTSETSETDYPYHVISQKNGVLNWLSISRHITEERSPELHHRENLTTRLRQHCCLSV